MQPTPAPTAPRAIELLLDRLEDRLGVEPEVVLDGDSEPTAEVVVFVQTLPLRGSWPSHFSPPLGWTGVCREVVAADRESGRPAHSVVVVCRDGSPVEKKLRRFLANGLLSLDSDPALGSGPLSVGKSGCRTCIVSNEIVGPIRSGGIGTACTSLAQALARAGQDVTILYTGGFEETGDPAQHWIDHYAEQKIHLECLDASPREDLDFDLEYLRRPWLVFEKLEALTKKSGDFDVVHFPECNGLGYYAIQAKQCGTAFPQSTLCVATHGSTRWHLDGNRTWMDRVFHFIEDHTEPYTIEHCDVLHAPSHYLADWADAQGWKLPDRLLRMPYVQPADARAGIDLEKRANKVTGLHEIVLFGRIETRKGAVVVCDAIEALAAKPKELPENFSITFLGKPGVIEGEAADQYLEERGKGWPFPWKIVPDLDQAGANAYLAGEGRLALMPSLVDNYPNTVMECLGLGLPFLTSRTGGIPEILHPEDLEESTFQCPPGFDWGTPLADRIRQVLKDGLRPARPAFSRTAVEASWVDWHTAIAGGADQDLGKRKTANEKTVTIHEERGTISDLGSITGPVLILPRGWKANETAGSEMAAALSKGKVDVVGALGSSEATKDEPIHFPLAFPAWLPGVIPNTGIQPLCLSEEAIRHLVSEAPETPLEPIALLAALTRGGLRHVVLPRILFQVDPVSSNGTGYENGATAAKALAPLFPTEARMLPSLFQGILRQNEEQQKEVDELRWHMEEDYGRLQKERDALVEQIAELAGHNDDLVEKIGLANDGKIKAESELEEKVQVEVDLQKQIEEQEKEIQTIHAMNEETIQGLENELKMLRTDIDRLQRGESEHEERLKAHAERFEEVFQSINERLAKRDGKISDLREKCRSASEEISQLKEKKSGGWFSRG